MAFLARTSASTYNEIAKIVTHLNHIRENGRADYHQK